MISIRRVRKLSALENSRPGLTSFLSSLPFRSCHLCSLYPPSSLHLSSRGVTQPRSYLPCFKASQNLNNDCFINNTVASSNCWLSAGAMHNFTHIRRHTLSCRRGEPLTARLLRHSSLSQPASSNDSQKDHFSSLNSLVAKIGNHSQ